MKLGRDSVGLINILNFKFSPDADVWSKMICV